MLYTIYSYCVIPSELSGNQPNSPLEPTPVYYHGNLQPLLLLYTSELFQKTVLVLIRIIFPTLPQSNVDICHLPTVALILLPPALCSALILISEITISYWPFYICDLLHTTVQIKLHGLPSSLTACFSCIASSFSVANCRFLPEQQLCCYKYMYYYSQPYYFSLAHRNKVLYISVTSFSPVASLIILCAYACQPSTFSDMHFDPFVFVQISVLSSWSSAHRVLFWQNLLVS